LKAAATGNPNLDSEYYLVYIGLVPLHFLTPGPLARRISTYKIGAFLLSACGLALAPVVAATATVPIMALPGIPLETDIDNSRLVILVTINWISLSYAEICSFNACLCPASSKE
jgi:hypothetical protein